MMRFLFVASAVLGVVACGKKPVEGTTDAATSSSAAPADAAIADASMMADASIVDAAVDAGGHHILVLRWQVAKTGAANDAKFAVTLRAGSQTIPVGDLDATEDDATSGTPKACSLKKTSSTESSFKCGGVPAYNFLTASLKDGELIITRTTGVDGEKNSEKTKEVKRVPVTEGALRTLAYKPPVSARAAKPKCPTGQIASEATGEWRCTQLCTSDADCKAGFFCDVQRAITPDGRIGAVLDSPCEQETK